MEELREVVDFPGYWVNHIGQVFSDWCKNGWSGCNPKYRHELKPTPNGSGYLKVRLYKDGVGHTMDIHRLVAEAFIPNPDNLPEVNHRDEDKTNNRVENLEWCTREYNLNYGTHNERMKEHQHSKPVTATTKDGVWVGDYPSVTEAARQLGVFATHITQCCKGNLKQTGGFVFTYK